MDGEKRKRLRAMAEAFAVGPAIGPQPTRQELVEALGDALLLIADTVERLTRERDEARAEVERLRAGARHQHEVSTQIEREECIKICDEVEQEAHESRAKIRTDPRCQLHDLSRQEGRALAANRIAHLIAARGAR